MTDRASSTHCECTPVYETQYEANSEGSPIVVVIEALATVKGVHPLEMDPLYDVIDVEAVDRLFQNQDNESDSPKTLSFAVEGWNVFVREDGSIRLCDRDKPTDTAPVFEKEIAE